MPNSPTLISHWPSANNVSSLPFEKRVTVHKLANGLTLVVMERPEAPVFSFFTLVDAGAVQDPKGLTGLAHMMEHEAFKGTPNIGTSNWSAEKAALEQVEKAFAAYNYERKKESGRDPEKLEQLQKAWQDATAISDKYVVENEFSKILDSEGEVGMNASTSSDDPVGSLLLRAVGGEPSQRAGPHECRGSAAARPWAAKAMSLNPHFSLLWTPTLRRLAS